MNAFRHRQQQAGLIYDLLPPERGLRVRGHRAASRRSRCRRCRVRDRHPTAGANARSSNTGDRRSRAGQQSRPAPEGALPSCAHGPAPLPNAGCSRPRAAASWHSSLLSPSWSSALPAVSPGCPVPAGSRQRRQPLQFVARDAHAARRSNGMKMLSVYGVSRESTDAATLAVPADPRRCHRRRPTADEPCGDPPARPHRARREPRHFRHACYITGGKMPDVRLSFGQRVFRPP